jgi:hypothetical protein
VRERDGAVRRTQKHAYNSPVQIPEAVSTLERDLRAIFGRRLQSLVVYHVAGDAPDAPTPTLGVVDRLSVDDLRTCADRVSGWHEAGLATPLLLGEHEFGRALDAFPLEFGAILADHALVAGTDPFDGLRVAAHDLRRACEVQARSHLLHLREGLIESRGRGDAVSDLIAASALPLAGLLASVARLHDAGDQDPLIAAAVVERAASLTPGSLSAVVALAGHPPPPAEQARRLVPEYLAALERLCEYIDRWNPA